MRRSILKGMLGIIETIFAIALLAYVAFAALGIFARVRTGEALIADAAPYDARTTDYRKTLLVLGDSTAVGVGAKRKEESLPALISAHIGATYVENHAKSGATVDDLSTQIQHLHLSHYHFILIMIGANDIIAFHDAKKTAKKLDALLGTLPDAEKCILLTAGNVGAAAAIPLLARPFYTFLNLRYHKHFGRAAKKRGMSYVNLYRKSSHDPFVREPERFLSSDGFHPSSEGYREWFEAVKKGLKK